MVRMFNSALAATALILAGVVPAGAQQSGLLEVPVSNGFVRSEIAWDSSLGTIGIAWAVLDLRGVAHVCGASSASSIFADRNTKKAFRKGWVKVGKTKVMTDLSFFTRAPRKTDLATVKARCKPLPRGAGAGKKFQLGFDPLRVRM